MENRIQRVPESGMARCLEYNGIGFTVGEVYRFTTKRTKRRPRYDIVTVESDDYRNHNGEGCIWSFINSHGDMFRKSFDIIDEEKQ